MLLSIVVPLTATADGVLPHHLGRANYAALLSHVQRTEPVLAQQIHDGEGFKPLTCSHLLNANTDRAGTHVKKNERYAVRITGLTAPVCETLQTLFSTDPPSTWSLLDHAFTLEPAVCAAEADPWTGQTTYEALAAQQLTQPEQPTRRVSFLFGSPTSFKSKGMHLPVPLPSLFFGSLVERWNHFSPVTLSPEMRRFGEERVALSNYRLQTRPVQQKSGAPLIGAVGRTTFTALGGDRYWLSVMQMLADFALYSGVGVKTTTGMGQVRRVG